MEISTNMYRLGNFNDIVQTWKPQRICKDISDLEISTNLYRLGNFNDIVQIYPTWKLQQSYFFYRLERCSDKTTNITIYGDTWKHSTLEANNVTVYGDA